MRPLIKNSENYVKTFDNAAVRTDTSSDPTIYFIQDYLYDANFRKGPNTTLRITDFFISDYKLLPNITGKYKEPRNPGYIGYIANDNGSGELRAASLAITSTLTLNAKIQTIEKHSESQRNKYLRLLIPLSEVKALLKIQQDHILYESAPAVVTTPLITNFTDLNDKLISLFQKELKDKYKEAKADLVKANGLYCAYCETVLTDGIVMDIEHKLPKASFPDVMMDWDNLVISCKPCNELNKGNNPKQVLGAQRIIYEDLQAPKDLDIRIITSLVPKESETLKQFNDELKKIAADQEYDGRLLKLKEKINKTELAKIQALCQLYGELESSTVIQQDLDNKQEFRFFPFPKKIRDVITRSGHQYNAQTQELTVTVNMKRKNLSKLANLRNLFKVDDAEDEIIINTLNNLNTAYLKLANLSTQLKFEDPKDESVEKDKKKEKREIAYLNFPAFPVYRGEELKLDYDSLKESAKKWNLWPDDKDYNPLRYLKYTYATNQVKVERIEPNAGDVAKYHGTQSIMDIVGINQPKNTLTDSRHTNRAKAWKIAGTQLDLVKQAINAQSNEHKLYKYFRELPKSPAAPEGMDADTWEKNWTLLKATFDVPGVLVPEIVWANLVEIACATGFYSTWLTVFKKDGSKELAAELALKLKNSAAGTPSDPHKYHSTNMPFVNDFINL
ncbi:hypothetical protein [Chitinophaga flava]|uniref:HNH nuclease domain-containing protein n=1 Tax=Chitinophaga flava TaxID=2259036 RepID=A0A365XV69_9BACT|nr:hypothetical protein [Chitinophaga flava]RBL89624.1 hypothetical protein DF182_24285 [Chitinophaga flava]